jgi:hypothetical protein
VHRQLGATWKTKHAKGWNASVVATDYVIQSDAARQANLAQPLADLGGAGTVTRRDGTGWNTFEVQSTYTPRPATLAMAAMRWCWACTATSTSCKTWSTTPRTGAAPNHAKPELLRQDHHHGAVWAGRLEDAPDWMLTSGPALREL